MRTMDMNLLRSCLFRFLFLAMISGPLFFPPSSFSSPLDYTATVTDARSAAQETMKKTGASSVSLALVDGGKLVWAEAFGLADRASKTAATTDTMYAIGSTSKMFAAIAVMKLVDRGRVALDEPVVTYLKTFRMVSPEYKKITVRMLINHSSGFPGTDWRNGFTTSPIKHGYSAQVLETLAHQRLKHPPGYLSVYCNDGFTLVEQLIPAVTGKSYAQFVRDEILVPLGMHNSRYMVDRIPGGSFAKRYDTKGAELPFQYINILASGGLYSTPSDIARLAGALIGKGLTGSVRILSERSVAEMAADQTLKSFNPVKSDMVSYGLGWDTVRQPGLGAVGVTAWQKGGSIPYTKSIFTVAPDERMAVFVVGASGNFSSDDAIVLAERVLLNALKEKGRISSIPARLTGKPLPEKAVPEAQLESSTGYYANSDSLMSVSRGPGNTLNISRYDAEKNEWNEWQTGLKMRTDGHFSRTEEPLRSFAFSSGDGRHYLVSRSVGGYGHYQDNEVMAQKVAAPGPLPASWKKRLTREWLLSNENPGSDAWLDPLNKLWSLGNMLFSGDGQVVDPFLSGSRAGMILVIPQIKGRDLNDVIIEDRGGEEWIRWSSFLFRPRETVAKLKAGNNTVVPGREGFAEWRFVDAADGPKTVSIAPDVPDGRWRIYDGSLKHIETGKGKKDFRLTGGKYYLLFHDSARVTY